MLSCVTYGNLVRSTNNNTRKSPVAIPVRLVQIQEAHRQDGGRHPRGVLALAALDVAGRGDTAVSCASLLQTLRDGVHSRHGGVAAASSGTQDGKPTNSSTASSDAAGGSRGALRGSRREKAVADRSAEELRMSFGSVATRSIGGS